MTHASESPEPLPKARVTRRRSGFSFIWLVPIAAVLGAGWLVYQRVYMFGPEIQIEFRDATGLRAGQTTIQHRGVVVGEVVKLTLGGEGASALVTCRLFRESGFLAREGAQFWIVRPEVGLGGIRGLGTIIAGPHIALVPGAGEVCSEFIGLERSPATSARNGLSIVLLTPRLNSLQSGAPVYYRGVQVGAVEHCQLSTNATTVDVQVLIEPPFTNLVRGNSRFWNVSGVDLRFGLFRGAEVNVESLRSLALGGISFATPSKPADRVGDGALFRLYEEPQEEWLEWNPVIPLKDL